MSSRGLLHVGAILVINGLMLLGVIPGKSTAILNFFVGTMQDVFPTIIILQFPDDLGVVFGAAGCTSAEHSRSRPAGLWDRRLVAN
ncbi:AmiS/UreI family transporter [Cryobacterium psychrophilum]|uniref:Uncharacterized protein n=1 Tax=Cryobacterium psychrophilum TaxID=41988 RepID=A0A4Y8KP05_9MICO|nr:AmiS/UreI family transporter [Cryobacterium psychrophilum]TDW30368.1 AmiS/UreI family transporter [Cryobacterium psychrophilum]TFD79061.1 hypothetical protein E3T53_08135 [Cryobacterium psychrophilum]